MFETDQDITNHLLFQIPTPRSDAGIILGSRSASRTVARSAARLYHGGAFKKIVISGGLKVFQPQVLFALATSRFKNSLPPASEFLSPNLEADDIRDELLIQGVPENAISFMDRKARNTGENFKFLKDALGAYRTATIVTLAPHQCRALGTADVQLGDGAPVLFTHAVYPFGITRDNWSQSPLASIVRGEAKKIDPDNRDRRSSYILQGFCTYVSPFTQAMRMMGQRRLRGVSSRDNQQGLRI